MGGSRFYFALSVLFHSDASIMFFALVAVSTVCVCQGWAVHKSSCMFVYVRLCAFCSKCVSLLMPVYIFRGLGAVGRSGQPARVAIFLYNLYLLEWA